MSTNRTTKNNLIQKTGQKLETQHTQDLVGQPERTKIKRYVETAQRWYMRCEEKDEMPLMICAPTQLRPATRPNRTSPVLLPETLFLQGKMMLCRPTQLPKPI